MTTQFTGKERDAETGLDYFGARYFSGAQGRFTTVDPTMESVVLSNPQTWNRYGYALNNPLRFVDPDGELWVASGSSSDPYSWVDSCAKGQTCFTSVAANIGRDLRVYGSTNAQDISNYGANPSSTIDLNAVAGQHDAEFLVEGGSGNLERFSSADAAAGLFNVARDYAADPRFAEDARLVITAASLETGAGSAAHPASHGDPNSAIDFRYIGANGQPIQGKNAAASGDPARNAALFGLFSKAGFNQTVSGRPKDFGSGPRSGDPALIGAHQDHGHAGIKRIKPPNR